MNQTARLNRAAKARPTSLGVAAKGENKMVRSKAQLLAGGVSLLALGLVAPGLAYAQNASDTDQGVYQPDPGQNLYTIPAGYTEYGSLRRDDDGGLTETTVALITCATSLDGDCGSPSWPGMIYQSDNSAAGSTPATNIVNVVGESWTRTPSRGSAKMRWVSTRISTAAAMRRT
jgi:hypothetical protein